MNILTEEPCRARDEGRGGASTLPQGAAFLQRPSKFSSPDLRTP